MIKDNDWKNYLTTDVECKCFHFHPDRWCQSFLFIWTPGYFIVVGDMGNLIIQVAALQDFESGMKFLAKHCHANCNYIMEKTNFKRDKFNWDKTRETLKTYFEDMSDEEVEEYWNNYFSDDLWDRIKSKVPKFHLNGDDVCFALDKITLYEQEAIEDIMDFEIPYWDYNWDFLNCRLDAINEFAKQFVIKTEKP